VPAHVPAPGTVVLVEGESDRNAVETLAVRLGRDLAVEGVAVVAMGGATNIRRHVAELGGARARGLYDAKEERFFRRALGTDDLEGAGFFRCEEDLEDELIRALGVDRVLAVVEERGELASYRILQRQPFHRGRPERDQLRRFLGTHSGRKIEYGGLLAAALDLDRIPRPMAALLDIV
jgi:hypothetical protein